MHLEVILLLLHFTPAVAASLKIRMCLILKKLLPLPAPFQHFRFGVCFCFQRLSSKCFHFHKKLTASASSFRFRFHIPGSTFTIRQQNSFTLIFVNKTEYKRQQKPVETVSEFNLVFTMSIPESF